MRQHQARFSNSRSTNTQSAGRSISRRRLVFAVLIMAAAICVFSVALPGSDAGSVSAQVSPLSPLGAPAVIGGAPLSLTQSPMLNVMASGQAGLTRLALLLLGIIVGVSIIIWRKP